MKMFLVLALLASPLQATEAPMYVRAIAGGSVVNTGDHKATIVPFGRLRGDGPLLVGRKTQLRLYAQLDLSALPGDSQIGDVRMYRSLELTAGAYWQLGRTSILIQDISTNIFAEVGFESRLPKGQPARLRYPRHYLVGVRFQEDTGGGYFSVGYGRHEAVGDSYGGEVVISGLVPVIGTNDLFVIGGEAMLSVGRAYGGIQRDIVRVTVAVDLIRALDLLSE